ncbi:MAG TPA: AmmeMemoRadiSam system radical SAM enzyme [Phycisphaerae bacterium]|nr:AmmeMemoRadiSam system radical SAM enzyme [Phycisphaerae bacterium]
MSGDTLDRRRFLALMARYTGGACLACGLDGLISPALGSGPVKFTRQVEYVERLADKKVQCFVCPLHCILAPDQTCPCRTRTNVDGTLYTRAYNNPCIVRPDPIEKMPLLHFRPGSKILTVAIGGCNLRCLYCQNWEESQKRPDELKTFDLSPEQAVAEAKKKKIDTIAFNYTETVAFLEYAKDVATAAKKAKLKVVVGTSAFIEPKPLLDFAKHVDAFVISLKGFDEDFYHRVSGVSLEPILTSIKTIKKETKCWLELINVVVPTYNDNPATIEAMCRWIHQNLGDTVPLHFARFVPMYKLANLPQTPVQTLEAACDIGRKAGLRFVYTSNISPHPGNNTICPDCQQPLIQRLGFKILDNKMSKGTCPKCHHRLPGVWV